MAETERSNLPIAEEPEFMTEIPAIRPDDPVHFAQMNAMLESLLGNDVFLKNLANKMLENSLIAHVLDCENPQMVLGADQGPVITGLIDEMKGDITQLYSDIQGIFIIVSPKKHVTVPVMSSQGYVQVTFLDIPPEGYRLICAIGFFISSGYPHLYGSYPDKDDPNRWSFSIYNNTTITGDAGVTGYFLCVKNMQ